MRGEEPSVLLCDGENGSIKSAVGWVHSFLSKRKGEDHMAGDRGNQRKDHHNPDDEVEGKKAGERRIGTFMFKQMP